MGVLLLKCPHTDLEFSPGIMIEEESVRKLPNVATKTRCPYCGLTHTWWPREARWVEGVPPDQWTNKRAS
jgi:hypothetical protein